MLIVLSQLSIPYLPPERTKTLNKTLFATRLVAWYQTHQRDLPWRKTNDPYRIWLSEIILQQTRVAQGLPYYQKFIEHYPTVQALAAAEEEAVLRLWQGLGYYSRARNLHACARMIVNEWQGQFPSTYQTLLQLKGVGKYTAAAVASIAFKEPVAVVDGNVYRVLSRVFGVEEDIATTQGVKAFAVLAQSLVSKKDPDLYNQAIMEFGALHCTPVNPQCTKCIFKDGCVAFQTGKQRILPVKSKKVKVKKRYLHYLVIQHGDKLYMKRRSTNDIWAGLYDFYLVEDDQLSAPDVLEDALARLMRRHQLVMTKNPTLYKHVLTHRQLYVHFFQVQATASFLEEAQPLLQQAGVSTFTVEEAQALPKPILIDNFLKEEFYS